jgi:hypothetical protein
MELTVEKTTDGITKLHLEGRLDMPGAGAIEALLPIFEECCLAIAAVSSRIVR